VADYLSAISLPPALKPKSDVRVLVAEGPIVAGRPGPGSVGSEDLRDQLRALGRDEAARAIVFRVNSPGGDAVASEKIRLELQALRDAGKTVVVSMGDVAASGGYWISMSSDEVWASPATITGSIGVFGFLPTFGATLEKVGIHSDGVGTTELAGKLRIDRPLDPRLGRVFQASVENTYDRFLELVSAARGMSIDEVDEVARGRVWSGSQAADKELVDRVGTLQEAIDSAARIAGLGENYTVDYHRPELSPFEQFIQELTTGVVSRLPAAALPAQLEWLRSPVLRGVLEDLQLIGQADGRLTVAAHCLCGAP
jgi:protease-4